MNSLTFASQIILVPNISSEWRSFDGWYIGDGFETLLDSVEVTGSTTLYGKWDKYRVSFDMNGGENISYSSNGISHNDFYSEFPVVNKTGYKLIGWFTESEGGEKVEESSRVTYDHTLYAQWIPNNYTVTFDVNGGNELGTREKEVTFDSIYGTLPTPTREGYSFIEWFTGEDESITEETIAIISSDHTLYAQWKEVIAKQVEIVFGTMDLTEDEIKVILEEYTDSDFTIVDFENESDGVKVVIRFNDEGTAEEFVRKVRTLGKDGDVTKTIKRISFSTVDFGNTSSFIMLYPNAFLNSFMI